MILDCIDQAISKDLSLSLFAKRQTVVCFCRYKLLEDVLFKIRDLEKYPTSIAFAKQIHREIW